MRTIGRRKKEVLYVAFDVEAAGPRLGVHSTLSVGACVVSREKLSYEQYVAEGLLFYSELRPESLAFEREALEVCGPKFDWLKGAQYDPLLDPKHKDFSGEMFLAYMANVGEDAALAAQRFRSWLCKVRDEREVIPLFDTVLFDSPCVRFWLDTHGGSPLGHSGRDLKSIYQGHTGRRSARLREIKVPRNAKPHHAGHDAVELAQKGKVLLFDKLGW